MLELRNITKDYVSGNNVTHALKGISVNFRKNEFVSILGQSGCGKTTTLNIIGGLDRYTKGNLLINGKSTKQYKDRDWDTYRNHSIGFVFQTYNLITHQNILRNVELALTISGVSREERRQRAYQVLKIVGLEGMEKKKPNQLSGGQCQRVAIARALINNPDILLADEPTGALDSETSIQIMDLLKEVASDRLVIMVTHNPDLANKYSTRIITMSDGLLTSDSNPFDGKEEKNQEKPENSTENAENTELKAISKFKKGKKKKSSMSLWTSMGLSLSNLRSKMRRTVLVTIAGSIGIIGVSAVLGVSRGVKDYIADMENDMLSSYPISIAEESVDYTSLMTGLSNRDVREKFKFDPANPSVGINSMIEYLMTAYSDITKVKTNYIDDNLLDYVNNLPNDAASVIKYNYGIDVTNNIFGDWKENKDAVPKQYSLNGLTQSYIEELKTVDGFDEYATFVNLFTNFMREMPDSKEYILEQYDVIAGEEPSLGENDLVFVVDKDTTLTDIILAEMGIFNHDEFLNIAIRAIDVQKIKNNEDLNEKQKQEKIDQIIADTYYTPEFKFDELLSRKYKYYPQNRIYQNGTVTTDRVQVYVYKQMGSMITSALTLEYDEFGDRLFGDYRSITDIETVFSPWEFRFERTSAKPTTSEPLEKPYGVWEAKYTDKSNAEHTYVVDLQNSATTLSIDGGAATPMTESIGYETFNGYFYHGEVQPDYGEGTEMQVKSILRLKDSKQFGCLSSGIYYSKQFAEKFMADSVAYENPDVLETDPKKRNVTKALENYIGSSAEKTAAFNAYVQFEFKDHRKKDESGNPKISYTCASSLNGDISSSFSDLFASITGTNNVSVDSTHLRSISGLKANLAYYEGSEEIDAENTTFSKIPQSISIYPSSFEAKDKVTSHLDKWNDDGPLPVEKNGEVRYVDKTDRHELTYTDTISLIVSVIDTFINAITIALVVFTSLSLVVSCFMIAVVTYISVVERIKEIGVIRSLGGRKGDVASLFIVETMMTGLFSGVFGIFITYILEIIVNAILVAKFGIAIMNLTVLTALMMVGISIALSVLSGLIPSQSAAHKDPVVALRSNE